MFAFSDKINSRNFFRFDKMLTRSKTWAKLSYSGKAVFPVIASFASPKNQGWCWPSESTIAALAGITEKYVRQGAEDLVAALPNFKIARNLTARGHYAKRYRVGMPPEGERGRYFFFNRAILDGGNWCEATSTAKALYVVMRTFAYWETTDMTGKYGGDVFKLRDAEFCTAEPDVLIEFSGISCNSLQAALESLYRCALLYSTGTDDEGRRQYKVMIKPDRIFRPEYLNRNIQKRPTK